MTQVRVILRRKAKRGGLGENFPPIINIERVCQLETRSGSNQGIQIQHGPTIFPYERMEKGATVRGTAYNLSFRINGTSTTAEITRHRPQIMNDSIFPQYRIM